MRIDVAQQIMGLDGTPVVTGRQVCPTCGQVVGKSEPITIRLAATRSLTAMFQDEQALAGDEKVARFHLALKITDEDNPNLSAEEIVEVKEVVGKMYGPVIVGRMWAILDPPEKAE